MTSLFSEKIFKIDAKFENWVILLKAKLRNHQTKRETYKLQDAHRSFILLHCYLTFLMISFEEMKWRFVYMNSMP